MRVSPLSTTLSVDLLILDGNSGEECHPCNHSLFVWPYRRAAVITLMPERGCYYQKLPAERQCQQRHWYIDAKCTPNTLMQVIGQALAQQHAAPSTSCIGCLLLLSLREREVVLALGRGLSPTQVAGLLRINIKTVSSHKRMAMRKLGFRRTHELQQWVRHELVYELG